MGVGDGLVAKLTIGKGLDEYIAKLGNLEFSAPEAMGRALYDGAKVVADATKSAIQALPVESASGQTSNNHHALRGLTAAEKQGLIEGFGVSKSQDDNGFVNVKLGVDGYNSHVTKKYPRGHPNLMIARSLERGTSFMRRNPIFSKTARAKKAEAERVMQETLDREIEKTMN